MGGGLVDCKLMLRSNYYLTFSKTGVENSWAGSSSPKCTTSRKEKVEFTLPLVVFFQVSISKDIRLERCQIFVFRGTLVENHLLQSIKWSRALCEGCSPSSLTIARQLVKWTPSLESTVEGLLCPKSSGSLFYLFRNSCFQSVFKNVQIPFNSI